MSCAPKKAFMKLKGRLQKLSIFADKGLRRAVETDFFSSPMGCECITSLVK